MRKKCKVINVLQIFLRIIFVTMSILKIVNDKYHLIFEKLFCDLSSSSNILSVYKKSVGISKLLPAFLVIQKTYYLLKIILKSPLINQISDSFFVKTIISVLDLPRQK